MSDVWNSRSDVLASSRTTNAMWLAPIEPDSPTARAMYTPDTAFAGTLHDTDSAQLPQSMSPVTASLRHAGCVCGSAIVGRTVAIFLAPNPA